MVTDSNYQLKLDPENGQKIGIKQICENVELCVIGLHDLNRQIAFSNIETFRLTNTSKLTNVKNLSFHLVFLIP